MRHLLDVNVLLALGIWEHKHHARVSNWLAALADPVLLTCAITELGFVRIASQTGLYGYTVDDAKALLAGLKRSSQYRFELIDDGLGAASLPGWVKNAGETTDGHLLELAREHGADLATLDGRIPGASLIL